MTTRRCLVLFVAGAALLASRTSHAQLRNCSVTDAYPRRPVQVTMTLKPQPSLSKDKLGRAEKVASPQLPIESPDDRYLVIDSVAVKGTHPANTYLAIEIGTNPNLSTRYPSLQSPPLQNPLRGLTLQTTWVRHFVYARETQKDAAPLHVRERLEAISGPGAPVYVGVQSTAESPIGPIVVTVTGHSIDACLWGKE